MNLQAAEEHRVPLALDCSRLRPAGAEGAILAISVAQLHRPDQKRFRVEGLGFRV